MPSVSKRGIYCVQNVQNRRSFLEPTQTSILSIVAARRAFARLVNRVAYSGERIVLTRHGRRIAAVVPMSDMLLLQNLDAPDRRATTGASIARAIARAVEDDLGLARRTRPG